MRRLVDGSDVLASHFFNRIRNPTDERELLLEWALQDRYTSYVFPQLIAVILAGLSGFRQEICFARIPIAENLWEELGKGDSSLAHSALMDALVISMGIDEGELAAPMRAETDHMLTAQLELCRTDPIAGLGAFCYGNEYLALREYAVIKSAVAAAFPGADLRFFDANHEADGRHTRYLERALELLCDDAASRRRCQDGIELSLSVRRSFYDALCEMN